MVALGDAWDRDHARCRTALEVLTKPLVTTWPALTEAMYLLHGIGGWRAEQLLWRQVQGAELVVAEIGPLVDRIVGLMAKYQDTPMSLTDASLVAIAEARGIKTVFTLDADFAVYRYRGRESFRIVPS